MGVPENKELVRRFYEEVWDRGNVEFAHQVFADDYVRHDLRATQALPGAAGMAKIAADFRRAFPDARWRLDIVLGEDDLVAARWTATSTHSGAWGDTAPTGKAATFSWSSSAHRSTPEPPLRRRRARTDRSSSVSGTTDTRRETS